MERKKDQTVKNEPKGKSKKRSYNNLLILVVGQSSFEPTDQLLVSVMPKIIVVVSSRIFLLKLDIRWGRGTETRWNRIWIREF